jgi:ABC-type uncharacterized transport system substrate-binding protein
VRAGLVPSLNRPGGNITGVTFFGNDLTSKRLELLHELLPNAAVIALLMDQNNADALSQLGEVQEAARTLGLQLVVLNARTASDVDMAFMALEQQRANALVVGSAHNGASLKSRRLHAGCRSGRLQDALASLSIVPAKILFRLFRNIHHRGF